MGKFNGLAGSIDKKKGYRNKIIWDRQEYHNFEGSFLWQGDKNNVKKERHITMRNITN